MDTHITRIIYQDWIDRGFSVEVAVLATSVQQGVGPEEIRTQLGIEE